MNDDRVLAPGTWGDYIGQDALKARLDVHIEASRQRRKPLDHMLLVGPPGAGKSTIAELTAARLDDPIVTLRKPPTPRQLLQALYELGAGILFLDEIHCIPARQQNELLSLLEAGVLDTDSGPVEFEFITVIGATTERDKLIGPLRDRFMIQPRWVGYTDDEMRRILLGMAGRAGVEIADDTAHALGQAAAGVPRHARRFVVAARDMTLKGLPVTAETVLEFCDTEPDGLTAAHLDYLHALLANTGRAGIDVIATRLQESKQNVAQLERMLLDKRLITLDSTGRILTAAGRARIGAGRPTGRFARAS